MSKASHMCIGSVCLSVIGIGLASYHFVATALSYRSRSLLVLFSCSLLFIGIVSFLTSFRQYVTLKGLQKGSPAVVARWTYPPDTSKALRYLVQHQKHTTLLLAVMGLLFVELFLYLFASGEPTFSPRLGYVLAVLVFIFWIIICHFILNYYEKCIKNESLVLFSKECVYFMDTVYYFVQGIHLLQKVTLHKMDGETLLVFTYGLGDGDASMMEVLTIPIPEDKLQMAHYLKTYYNTLLTSETDDF